jgi:hypothetical protein
MYTYNYQSAMALLVIDCTYSEGRDGELVVKELAAADSQSNRVSSYVFKRPYAWEEVPMFNARINQAMDHGCNWDDGDILYSELGNILHRAASSAVARYCFGTQKTVFISNLIECTVIDITKIGCPQLEDICFPTISCTTACHNISKYACALRSTHSLAEWPHVHIISTRYARCPLQPRCH